MRYKLKGWIVIFLALGLFFAMWLKNIIRLGKNKSKGGMIAVILCGILCSFLIGWIVGMCISSDKDDTERERETKLTKWKGGKWFNYFQRCY